MKRYMVVGKRWVEIERLNELEPAKKLTRTVNVVREHFGFIGTRQNVENACYILSKVIFQGRLVGGRVTDSDLDASLDSIGHRAKRALDRIGIKDKKPELRLVEIESDRIIFIFQI